MSDKGSVFWSPEWEESRGALGRNVPRVMGAELVTAMRENVAEAMKKLAAARTALLRLRDEGKVVVDEKTNRLRASIRGMGKGRMPDPEGDVGLFDWFRAVGELAHWQEYLDWAKGKLRENAPDARLPREPGEDDGDDSWEAA